jgi:hypothetical protein
VDRWRARRPSLSGVALVAREPLAPPVERLVVDDKATLLAERLVPVGNELALALRASTGVTLLGTFQSRLLTDCVRTHYRSHSHHL